MRLRRSATLLLLALSTASASLWCEPGGGGEPCEEATARCEGEVVVGCLGGEEVRTPCGEGFACEQGACVQRAVVMPRDAGPHDQRTEWWYYTGHLVGGDRRFSFQLTLFQYSMQTFTIFMCHVAVVDHEAGVHYHADQMDAAATSWTREPVVLDALHCRFELDGAGNDRIRGTIAEGAEADGHPGAWLLDLEVTPDDPVVLHGGDGLVTMGAADNVSWYYSYPRLAAEGSLETPEGRFEVSGQAWMDHQWGDFDINFFKGWDWWSIQLDDGSEIMLFQFRDWSGRLVEQAGTLVEPDGTVAELEGLEAFSISAARSWASPHTDGVYPLDWTVSIPASGHELEVLTGIDDQEMHNPVQHYWEGAVTVSGTRGGVPASGLGFVELTGYATDLLDP